MSERTRVRDASRQQRVIDFRVRPNVPELAAYLQPRLEAIAADTQGTFGSYHAPPESLGSFVERLDDAGIDVGVVAARSRSSRGDWQYTRDVVTEAIDHAPTRLVGLVGLDLHDIAAACEEARIALTGEAFIGVSFDPFQLGTAADSRELDPIYELCSELGALTVVTLGGLPGIKAPLECSDPLALDRVAQRHPELTLVASHAGWPFTLEMIAVAWRNPGVYFENSFYHRAPGAQLIVDAANEMIPGKLLFASAYPFAPMAETLASFRSLPFADGVLERVLWDNPRRLIEQAAANLGRSWTWA